MNKKEKIAVILAYLLAVAFWNLIFTIIVLTGINIVAYISETEGLGLFDSVKVYTVGYCILCIFNIKMLKNYIKDKQENGF